ncbi:MAG: bifunctional folylpolyglutamate synthase/ dihydrofolate synthase [Desulfobulbus propionicus]|nr:MAG: bifunctional folylpolyglutamate synthase/ dihydrofolate synthase [Desulfobulbus propionicus]
MKFSQALAYLNSLQMFKIKLGLVAMDEVLARLDHPHRQLRMIHLAGTNGKGSVGAALTSMFTAGGYEVGFYSSPHLDSPRERFRIGKRFISEETFTDLLALIRARLNDMQITYFEFTTAMAFTWFAQQKVDLAVIETGMGGRLDATNVIRPEVSVITSISMDHEQYLGDTLAKIAGEKAGIIKAGVPVVTSVNNSEALQVITDSCSQKNCQLYLLGRDFSLAADSRHYSGCHWQLPDIPLSLAGTHQQENIALALCAAELLRERLPLAPDHLRQGLEQLQWPGRQERLPPRRPGHASFLLDGGHNPAGIAALKTTLQEEATQRRVHLIWAAMEDKHTMAALCSLLPLVQTCLLTRGTSDRFSAPEALFQQVPRDQRHQVRTVSSVANALDIAENIAGPEDIICVAGSLYLVGEVRCLLVGPLVSCQ